jgi:hypothetical protein
LDLGARETLGEKRNWICLLLLTAGVAACQNRGGTEDIRDRFAGPWRLAWLEQPGVDGNFTGSIAVACLSSHAMASWGVYTVEERAGTFTFTSKARWSDP